MPIRTSRRDEFEVDGPDSDKRYHGKYLAFVRDSNDPEQRGRVRVYCPEVMGEIDSPDTWLDWAEASHFMAGFDQGFMSVPPDPTWKSRDSGGESSPFNNTRVWISFRNGDPARPLYETGGSWYGENQLPHHAPSLITSNSGGDETTSLPNYVTSTTRYSVTREGDVGDAGAGSAAGDLVNAGKVEEPKPQTTAQYPYNHIYKSPAGHVVEFDNTPGGARFRLYHPAGSSLEINDAGTWATKIQGKESTFVVGDSTRVVKGACTIITEGTSHEQYNRSNVQVYRDSRMEVVERSYEAYYKSGWYREVGGRVTTICADFQVDSVGTVQLTAGGGASLTADEVSVGGQTVEVAGTDTAIKGTSGVKISKGDVSLATHPIYASLNIDTDLKTIGVITDTLNEATITTLLTPKGIEFPSLAGTASLFTTVIRAIDTIVSALERNKTGHLAGPAEPPGSSLPSIPTPKEEPDP